MGERKKGFASNGKKKTKDGADSPFHRPMSSPFLSLSLPPSPLHLPNSSQHSRARWGPVLDAPRPARDFPGRRGEDIILVGREMKLSRRKSCGGQRFAPLSFSFSHASFSLSLSFPDSHKFPQVNDFVADAIISQLLLLDAKDAKKVKREKESRFERRSLELREKKERESESFFFFLLRRRRLSFSPDLDHPLFSVSLSSSLSTHSPPRPLSLQSPPPPPKPPQKKTQNRTSSSSSTPPGGRSPPASASTTRCR